MTEHSHHHTNSQLSRVQQALALAKQESDPHKKAVLARILEQRIRLKGHELAKEAQRNNTYPQSVRSFTGQSGASGESHNALQYASYGSSLFYLGRDIALKHPISVGFVLGACLVLAPKSLIRSAIQTLPLLLRIGR